MTSISRRAFLARSASAVGALSLAVPFRAYAQSPATAEAAPGEGYGQLVDRGELALPDGFDYRVISSEGAPMSDGNPTPSRFDGMAAFAGARGTTVLIRNHENKQSHIYPFPAFEVPVVVPAAKRYDPAPQFNGGDTKLVLDPDGQVVQDFAVLGGTTTNCAGGRTPWGSWLTCEEKFDAGERPHGYVFEIDAEASGPVEPVPLERLGRFYHEAVAWLDGSLYLTEDLGGTPVCFYRYVPDSAPRAVGDLARVGGTLQALRVRGRPGLEMSSGIPVGSPMPVEWVKVEDFDPAENVMREEPLGKGAARFTREEGAWVGNGRVYFDCTDGGEVGQGQVWEYDPSARTIELIYESPGAEALQGPDNMVVGPAGDVFICEDPTTREPFVRVLSPDGRLYPFARAIANPTEFCGACFAPDGSTLYVNQQGSPGLLGSSHPGVTYAIRGPFGRGIAS